MSERIVIEAEPREVVGKQVSQLRRDGWIPGVVYGKGEPQSIQMERKSLRRALRVVGTTHLADLSVDGSVRPVLVREIQQHLTRGDLIHVDFLAVDMKNTIRMEIELVTVGMAPPEADGLGVVTMPVRAIEIEALPDALVSQIEVDATIIATADDVITVNDIVAPKGVTILSDPELVVARFEYATLATEEEEEEGIEDEFGATAEDVEVISKGKQDEEEDF
ncbi:MAG: 50S ribosomal protein L25 [Chloroflexota bacterium]